MPRSSTTTTPAFSSNALHVLEARYLRRDEQRQVIETPEELFERVAQAVAHAELLLGGPRQAAHWEEEFHRLLTSRDFLPNSPTLMNAGTSLGQLSACFGLPVDDSMESIFDAVKQMALVQRTGGGTGFSFSRLRAKGSTVRSTGGEASGPLSFMKIFDCATENIKLGGKRRGANMGVLEVDHPDILEFITAKRDERELRNFNLSVGVSDSFMEAARAGQSYPLADPTTRLKVGQLPARRVFDAIIAAAWESGDPGLLFLDAVNRANPTPALGRIAATNPCGEIPLLPYESCNLGSINLARMVRNEGDGAVVDWERLEATASSAVRFLDDVIEVSRYPTPDIERMTRGNRKIGLGVMGFAEMLIRLGISYGSDPSVQLARRLMRCIHRAARHSSRQLAGERGVFPSWAESTYGVRGDRIRNATLTAIAPTGTISIIAGTTASIEPLFALAYRRTHVLGEETQYELAPLLREHAERSGVDTNALIQSVMKLGRLGRFPGVPEGMKHLFVTALEIPTEQHLRIQAAFQEHTDNSVSKTVNLPAEAAPAEVAATYWRAWELGLKGITIYRYGSKAAQVLELGVGEEPYHYDHASSCDPTECRV
jgi:ribonucleoside-diphosphate reductase alpha chain